MRKTGTPNQYRKELKEKILSHAMREFRAKGIRAVTMNDIAQSLSISKRTVYEIYKDKEEILLDGLRFQYKIGDERIKEAVVTCTNVIEKLAVFYNLHFHELAYFSPEFSNDIQKYPKAKELIEGNIVERNKRALEFFKHGVEEGFFRADVDYNVVMEIGSKSSRNVMEERLYEKYPIQHIFRNFLLLYLRGICTLKGVQLLDELIKD